jgi:acyl carrier protein
MGLDIVEVVLEIERAFEVRLVDDDYQRCATVGGMRDVIVEKLRATGRVASRLSPCLSTAAFCKMRQALISVSSLDRRRIHPSAGVAGLIDVSIRRRVWRQWQQALGMGLPRLQRPWTVVFAASVVVGSSYVMVDLLNGGPHRSLQFAAAGAAFLTALAAAVVTRPLAVVVPEGAGTFGDLTSNLVVHHSATLRAEPRLDEARWTPQEVQLVLKSILVEQLGVSPDLVTPAARIVEDLGAD